MRLFMPLFPFPLTHSLIARPLSLSFFRQILGYADSLFISISDLFSTVTSYFDMSTAISIRDSIFCVDNMAGVGFLDSTGKSVTINYSDNHPRDVPSFTFLSYLKPNAVDDRAPHAVHQFEFSLRLPHNSTFSFVNISFPIPSVVPDQSSVTIFSATISGLSDALLN